MADEQPTAATKRSVEGGPALAGTAIGRPVEPRQPLSCEFPIYSGSSRKACTACGRPTWFGPRLTALIDAGGAKPACADCMIEALMDGARPADIANLGNPERPGRG